MQHTPGPWIEDKYQEDVIEITTEARRRKSQVEIAAVVVGFDGKIGKEQPANAKLLLAAPDLLAALKGMLRVCPSERHGMKLAEYEAARAAIRKAEGKP